MFMTYLVVALQTRERGIAEFQVVLGRRGCRTLLAVRRGKASDCTQPQRLVRGVT
jgi:hypothetical protein